MKLLCFLVCFLKKLSPKLITIIIFKKGYHIEFIKTFNVSIRDTGNKNFKLLQIFLNLHVNLRTSLGLYFRYKYMQL